MTELLSNSRTKKSLTNILSTEIITHSKRRGINYVVSSRNTTQYYFGGSHHGTHQINHEEADTSLILCLAFLELRNLAIFVYSIDIDIFVLLLKHLPVTTIKKVPSTSQIFIAVFQIGAVFFNRICKQANDLVLQMLLEAPSTTLVSRS